MSSEQHNLEVVKIVRKWNSNDLRQCKRYERRLRELGSTAIETLLKLAQQEVRKRRLYTYCFLFLCVALFAEPVLMPVIEPDIGNRILFIAYMVAFSFCGFKVLDAPKATTILAGLDNLRSVGLLIDTLKVQEVRPIIEEALIRLLPRIRLSNLHLVTAKQRKALYRTLPYYTNERLALTILHWLEQIGDEAAIPYVQKLTEPSLFRNPSVKIQKAAQECLPYLKEIAAQEGESDTLLRAAEGTTGTAAELLRPVSADTETDSRDLLRATQQE